jgi:hypothetical protein
MISILRLSCLNGRAGFSVQPTYNVRSRELGLLRGCWVSCARLKDFESYARSGLNTDRALGPKLIGGWSLALLPGVATPHRPSPKIEPPYFLVSAASGLTPSPRWILSRKRAVRKYPRATKVRNKLRQ